MRFLFYLLFALSFFSPAAAAFFKPYLHQTIGQGVGVERSYTTAGVLNLLTDWSAPSLFTPFIDIKGHLLTSGQKACSIGIGTRYLWPHSDRIIGAHLYYDGLYERQTHFHQVALGVEFLGQSWDMRAHAYVPLGKQQIYRSKAFNYPGGYVAHYLKSHQPLTGADIEFGWTFKEWNCFSPWGVYAAAGPYYFSTRAGKKSSSLGGQGHIDLQPFSFLTFEVSYSYDSLFHHRGYGKILLSLPLKSWGVGEEIWRKMTEVPKRKDLIVTYKKDFWEKNY